MPSLRDISLVIEAPRSGIAQSPYVGFGDVRNLDLKTRDGVAQLNNILAKVSGTTVTAQMNWFAHHPVTPAQIFGIDASANIYKSSNTGSTWTLFGGNAFTVTIANPAVFTDVAHGLLTNDTLIFTTTGALPTGLTAGTTYFVIATGLTADAFEVSTTQGGAAVITTGTQSGTHSMLVTTGANGNGILIWKNYLIVARNGFLDTCGDGTATGIVADNWTFNWQAITSDALFHPMLSSKLDSKLYGGSSNTIYTLAEVAAQTFAPGTGATFTFTKNALTLPPNYRVKCIEELGNNLMIGTWQGTNIYDLRVADIFTWNGSAPTYGQPIVMAEFGVHAMLNTGNSLIVLAGIDGFIYKCDGVNAVKIGKLPFDLSGGKYIEFYPGSICMHKGRVFFGVGQGGTTAITGMGVYSFEQTSKGNILFLEHLVSTLSDGTTNPLKPSALAPVARDTMIVGWRDNTTYGIDLTTNTSYAYATNYSGYFDSPLYTIGDLNNLVNFLGFELQLGKKLATGEGVQVSYRVNLTDAFTTVGTYTFAALGAVISQTAPVGIPPCETLQIRVALLGTATTTPAFKTFKLINYFIRGQQPINSRF